MSPKILVGLAYFEIRICHSDYRRGPLGPLGNAHHISLASIATNELVTRCSITERVKRLASNDIELGIEILTIESRASNISMTKGTTYVVMRSDR